LTEVVDGAFEARQTLQRAELNEIRQRLARTERQVAARDRIRDEIIQRRVEDLLNPSLQWEPPGKTPATSSPTPTSDADDFRAARKPGRTQIAVIGMLDLDRDGVDDAQTLTQSNNKWGIQVVARVTPDGWRIGPRLTPHVRYLVVDGGASQEESGVTTDGRLARFALESKKMRDEASEIGVTVITAGKFQRHVGRPVDKEVPTPSLNGSTNTDTAAADGPLLTFNFQNQPWKPVFEYVASKHGLSLTIEALPPGTFSYSDSEPKSPKEVIDLLNDILLPQGYALIVSEEKLRVVRAARDPRANR